MQKVKRANYQKELGVMICNVGTGFEKGKRVTGRKRNFIQHDSHHLALFLVLCFLFEHKEEEAAVLVLSKILGDLEVSK